MDVGVTELRAHLRRGLEAVQAGQEITITDRGKPIARIVPARGQPTYERLVAEGKITPAQRPRTPAEGFPTITARGSISDIVIEQRR